MEAVYSKTEMVGYQVDKGVVLGRKQFPPRLRWLFIR